MFLVAKRSLSFVVSSIVIFFGFTNCFALADDQAIREEVVNLIWYSIDRRPVDIEMSTSYFRKREDPRKMEEAFRRTFENAPPIKPGESTTRAQRLRWNPELQRKQLEAILGVPENVKLETRYRRVGLTERVDKTFPGTDGGPTVTRTYISGLGGDYRHGVSVDHEFKSVHDTQGHTPPYGTEEYWMIGSLPPEVVYLARGATCSNPDDTAVNWVEDPAKSELLKNNKLASLTLEKKSESEGLFTFRLATAKWFSGHFELDVGDQLPLQIHRVRVVSADDRVVKSYEQEFESAKSLSPSKWTLSEFSEDGELTRRDSAVITAYMVNEPIPDSVFAPIVPVGYTLYKSRINGAKEITEVIRDGIVVGTLSQDVKANVGPNRDWLFMLFGANFILAIVVFAYLRWKKRRKQLPAEHSVPNPSWVGG